MEPGAGREWWQLQKLKPVAPLAMTLIILSFCQQATNNLNPGRLVTLPRHLKLASGKETRKKYRSLGPCSFFFLNQYLILFHKHVSASE